MTRTRKSAHGLVPPPPLHPLMQAVLLLFASLVQGVRATFGMRIHKQRDDWHIAPQAEALPQTKPGIQIKETTSTTKSFSGSTRESFFVSTQGLADMPREAINRDSRDKPENDVAIEALSPVIPGAGALAPKTRNPGAARIDISKRRLWVPGLRGYAAPAGMTVHERANR